jgi:hypothetical protein
MVGDAGEAASGAAGVALCASGAVIVGLGLGVEAEGVTGIAGVAGRTDGVCTGG